MAKSSTLLQAGKHNETVYYSTISQLLHNSEDSNCLHDFGAFAKKKEAEQEKNG
jgi:hypothetical protein